MKAILMSQAGDPDVLTLQDVPIPSLKTSTQLLIRLKAAGINPIDTKIRRRGTFYPDHNPAILGCDGAGVVEEIGKDITNFKVGDELTSPRFKNTWILNVKLRQSEDTSALVYDMI